MNQIAENSARSEDMPCPVCGQNSYLWGKVDGEALGFTPEGSNLFTRMFSPGGTFHGFYGFRARLCIDCGNVQLFSSVHLPPADEHEELTAVEFAVTADDSDAEFVPPEELGLVPKRDIFL